MALSFASSVDFGSASIFNLSRSQSAFSKSFAQLASGKRINSAADDAAGLAIASGLAASITQISQSSRNVSDASSALAIADGALGQVSEISVRLQELATASANGTLSDSQRTALQAEYSALSSEVQRISETTTYNGRQLLDGSTTSVQVGSGSESLQVGGVNLQALSNSLTSQDISTQAGAQAAMSAIDQFSKDLSAQRSGTIDAAMSRLDSVSNNLSSRRLAQQESLSRIQDADIGSAVLEATRNKVLQQYQVSLINQSSKIGQSMLSILG
jgi:flagellin